MFPDLALMTLQFLFGSAPDGASSIVKTFGLFLTLAFLTKCLHTLSWEVLSAKEQEGILTPLEIWINPAAARPVDISINALLCLGL
ncbi:MAG: hypothetical protein IPK94_06115 [Saprospiraceae bacterium]|nr:hypothetical protein [Saprospiraceae bacterium]